MSVSLNELKKAIESLKVSLDLYHKTKYSQVDEKKAFRDACILRFEYCIELSWKTSLKQLGSNTAASKPAIREMARSNLIDNPELWFTFIDARNDTSHSYDDDIALRVFKKIEVFFPEVIKLISQLEKIK